MTDAEPDQTSGLEAEPGDAASAQFKVTGDPSAPPAAATDTLADLQVAAADARSRQVERTDRHDEDSERDAQ